MDFWGSQGLPPRKKFHEHQIAWKPMQSLAHPASLVLGGVPIGTPEDGSNGSKGVAGCRGVPVGGKSTFVRKKTSAAVLTFATLRQCLHHISPKTSKNKRNKISFQKHRSGQNRVKPKLRRAKSIVHEAESIVRKAKSKLRGIKKKFC